MAAQAIRRKFTELDDVPAGDGLWARESGALVWHDPATFETPAGAQAKADAAQAAAAAASDPAGTAAGAVSTHAADTTAVHGIADTSALETTTGAQAKADAAQTAAEAASIPLAEKGAANGVASLDASGLVPATQVGGSPTVLNAVTQYGAKGDGSVDAQPAIQAALDAAGATVGSGYKGAIVYLPSGNYVCHSKLSVPDGVTLRGAGKRATILRFSYDGTTPVDDFQTGCIRIGDGGANTVTGSRVESLRIFCSSSAEVGIYTTQANENCSIFNVAIHDFTEYGVKVERNGANSPVADCKLIDTVEMFVTSAPATAAVYLNDFGGTLIIENLSANMTGSALAKTDDGIIVVKGGELLVISPHFENCTDAIDVGNGAANNQSGVIIGLHTNNCTNGVHFQNGAASLDWLVVGARCASATATILDDLNGVTITDARRRLYSPGPDLPATQVGFEMRAGTYYYPQAASYPSMAAALNTLYASPLYVSRAVTADRIGVNVTAAAASSVVRLGIYADDGNGFPGALVLDAGTVDASTVGFKEITISQALPKGLYWVVAVAQVAGCSLTGLSGNVAPLGTEAGGNATASISALRKTGVSGALSGVTFSTYASTANGPKVMVRVA